MRTPRPLGQQTGVDSGRTARPFANGIWCSSIPLILWLLTISGGHAQEVSAPAKVAENYLRHIAVRDFAAAATLVDTASLERIKADQIKAVEALDNDRHRETLLRRLGQSSLEDLEALSPIEAFVARSAAQYSAAPLAEDAKEQLQKTLRFHHLGTIFENKNLAHALIRHSHERGPRIVQLFDMVSLVLEEEKWRVSLTAQEPIFTEGEDKKDSGDS